tara:strand:+ start:257 stop:709 length:453 start_codon:yes stop_codon:yes gene_type:complete
MSEQSTKSKIKKDLIDFMKSGDKDKVEIIRFALSFINQEEKDKNIELSEIETIQTLKKVIKRNQESYDQFVKANRNDLADKEKREIEIIRVYLPEEMSEEAIIIAVKKSILEGGANSIKDMGKVMTELRNTYGDKADMSIVSKHVKNLLS